MYVSIELIAYHTRLYLGIIEFRVPLIANSRAPDGSDYYSCKPFPACCNNSLDTNKAIQELPEIVPMGVGFFILIDD